MDCNNYYSSPDEPEKFIIMNEAGAAIFSFQNYEDAEYYCNNNKFFMFFCILPVDVYEVLSV